MALGTNLDPNQLSILAGQLAGAIAPGSIGAAAGGIAAQMGQATIMGQEGAASQDQLRDLVNRLTVEGADTTGLKIGPDGKITFTGEVPKNPDVQEAVARTKNTDVGGGNQTTNPFYQRLQGGEVTGLPDYLLNKSQI
jgi:hypothetical protein